MVAFSDRLKSLMEENNINAEQLSKNINGEITANTIRNYIKGTCKPKSIENIEILANYFGVSTDYLQGLTEEKTINIDIKNICNEYGLTEKALKNLKMFNDYEKKRGLEKLGVSTLDTINNLLEEITLICLIDSYFNLKVNPNLILSFINNGDIVVYDKTKEQTIKGFNHLFGEQIEEVPLLLIQNQLLSMKEKKKKVNHNERSGNNKKQEI